MILFAVNQGNKLLVVGDLLLIWDALSVVVQPTWMLSLVALIMRLANVVIQTLHMINVVKEQIHILKHLMEDLMVVVLQVQQDMQHIQPLVVVLLEK